MQYIQVLQHDANEEFLTYLRSIGLLNDEELVNATYEQQCMHKNALHQKYKREKYLHDNQTPLFEKAVKHYWDNWEGSQAQLQHWEHVYLEKEGLAKLFRDEDEFARKRQEFQREHGVHDKQWKKDEKAYIRANVKASKKAAVEGLLLLSS